MAKVAVTKDKLDALAFSVSAKSGESLPLTIDEMCDAVDGIETGGGTPTLQAKTYTVDSAGTETITADSGYDGLSSVAVSVPAVGWEGALFNRNNYVTESGVRKWRPSAGIEAFGDGWMEEGVHAETQTFSAVPSNTTITPSTSAQTIGGSNYMMEGAITVNPIPSQFIVPSGNLAITENGTGIDVSSYATVSVNVAGGGDSGAKVDVIEGGTSSASSISFSGLKGEPIAFNVMIDTTIATGTPARIAALVYDGSGYHAQTVTNTSNAQASYLSSGFSHTYSNGTLTINTSDSSFVTNTEYYITYVYGGNSANIGTADVQVGSGATSITFTGLEDEPIAWSCIFKSNFGTSSGYQRVMYAENNGTRVAGIEMDSSAKAALHWTTSYNNGSLTITSQGTNAGGYFHQPGYYQLTYVIGGEVEPVEIEVEPLSVTQNGTYTAPTGTAYSPVTVNVAGGGANIATTSWTNDSNTATSHQFTGLLGTPKAAFLRCTTSLSRSSSSTNYFIADMAWNGTSCKGNSFRRSNGTYADVTSGYSVTTGSNSITFTSNGTSTTNPGSFYNGTYELVYVY